MFLRHLLLFVALLLVVASTTTWSFEIKRIIRAQDQQQQQQQQQQYQYQPPPTPPQQQQPPHFRVNQQHHQQQQQYQHIQVNPGETPQEAAERFRRQRSEIYHKVKSKIEQQQKEELLAQQQYMLGMQDEDGDATQQKKPPGDIFVDHIFRPNEPPFVEICEGRRAETPGYHLQRLFEMSYDTVANFCYNIVHPSQWGNFFATKDEPKTAPKEAASSTKKPAQSSNGSSSGDGSILWRILSAILLLDGIDSPPRPKEDPAANSAEEQGIIGLFMDALLHGDALAIFSNAIFFTMLCVLVYIIWRVFLVFSNIMSPQRQQQQQQSFWDKWIDSIWWWQSASGVGGQQQQSDVTMQQQLMTDNDYQQYYNQGQDYYDDSDTAEIFDADAEYQEYGQH